MAIASLSYTYQAPKTEPFFFAIGVLTRSSDNAVIPCDLQNMDYVAFCQQVADGTVEAPAGWTGPTVPVPT